MVLHLKDDQENLRNVDCIRQLVKTHSQYVNYPISILVQKTKEVEVKKKKKKKLMKKLMKKKKKKTV